MPKYTASFPEYGDLEIDSGEVELSEAQLNQIAGEELRKRVAERPPERPKDFLSAVSERVTRAGEAAAEIPESLAGVVTGGEKGRLPAAFRLLQGVASPLSILTSPIGGATEAAAGTILPPRYAELAGDIGEMTGTLGLGLLAKAGKLGPYFEQLAKVLGVGRAGTTLEEAMKHDPQLRFVVSRELAAKERPLEEVARGAATTEELALSARSPQLAEAMLSQRKAAGDQWLEYARSNDLVVGEAPAEALFKATPEISFQSPGKDLGVLGTLGTPATRAASINPVGAAAAYEMQLSEMNLRQAIKARGDRVRQSLLGVGDDDLRQAVIARESGRVEADLMADPKIPAGVKKVLDFIQKKFAVDREIIIPRLRESAVMRIERQVIKEFRKKAGDWDEPLDDALVRREVDARVRKVIPDDWGIDQYLPHIFPGFYQIRDAKNKILATVNTKLEAKFAINDLVSSGIEAKGLHVSNQSFFDSDLLHLFKGRVQRTYESIAKGSALSEDEVQAAIRGEFGISKKFKFFGNLLERKGQGSGYSKDLLTIVDTYDRGIERWLQLSDLSQKVTPVFRELTGKGYPNLSRMLESTLQSLWGYRAPSSQFFDATIAGIPLIRNIVAPYALERLTRGAQSIFIDAFLKWNPRFHALNATQTAATLWPIAEGSEIVRAVKLGQSEVGKALLRAHGIQGAGKLAEMAKGLGPVESFNQATAFLTMYNKARGHGLSDEMAAAYGKLRGNVYSQFIGLTTDQPYLFQKLKFITPLDLSVMFQRFPIKQFEMALDLIKDRNYPGVAKWMATNLLLGGFKAATMGQAGWLTFKLYNEIKENYGEAAANVFHVGLPALLGVDMSNSVMLYNPPLGKSFLEKVGNQLAGPVGSVMSSVVGAALNSSAPEPNAAKRAFDALVQRVPLGRELDAVRRLWEGDYEFKDPVGRLRYKGDAKDAIKRLLGARTLVDADLDTFASALLEVRERRDDVLNYVASRRGQAMLTGVDLGESLEKAIAKEVDAWNSLWPEFPISGEDIVTRAGSRQQAAMLTLRERLLKQAPSVLRQSETFRLPEGGG